MQKCKKLLFLCSKRSRRVGIVIHTTISNDHGLHRAVTRAFLGVLNRAEHIVVALDHATKHHVLAVQVCRGARGDEKL